MFAASSDQPRVPSGAAARVSPQIAGPQRVLCALFGKVIYWGLLVATIAGLGYRPYAAAGKGRGSASVHGSVPLSADAMQIADDELEVVTSDEKTPLFSRRFLGTTPEAPSVHASTITRLPNGELIAAWFGGSREGARDVSIYQSRWSVKDRRWTPPRVVTDRAQTSRELGRYVKKLGNPVLFCDTGGRAWLYYVTVSVGGWSGGSISVKHSDDQGRTWSDARRLITTPFLNTSTLGRAAPISLQDGGVLLPVYHELLYQFGELLHLDADGQLVQKYRMNSGGDLLQPTLAPTSPTELLAFYRRGEKTQPELYFNRSTDAGQTWSEIQPTDLPNPNASIAVARAHGGEMLMVLNPSELNREQLAIARSRDGENWQMLEVLESGEAGEEFSYPSLIRGAAGVYHLTYTWKREKICHVSFNDAWLEAAR